MAPYIPATTARFYGWSIGTGTESASGNQRTQKTGRRRSENFVSGFSPGTTGFLRSSGKESNYNSRIGWIFSWRTIPGHRSGQKKPMQRTSVRPSTSKRRFGQRAVGDITADDIEHYLRRRLQTRVQFKTAEGVIQKDRLKPATVHQELRVLRRMLNVAVRKRLLPANPCSGVEFPVKVKGMFRPHYMSLVGATADRVPGT